LPHFIKEKNTHKSNGIRVALKTKPQKWLHKFLNAPNLGLKKFPKMALLLKMPQKRLKPTPQK
jgi:hypothetical protein